MSILNKSWTEISSMCKQKNKRVLKKCLEGRSNKEPFLRKLFDKCVLYDDGSCLASLLPYVATRCGSLFRPSDNMDHVVDYFDLLIISMEKNKKCFEYLVSIAVNINRHVYHCWGSSMPLLHKACMHVDDSAVSILLKYGVDVNETDKETRNSVLYYVSNTYNLSKTNTYNLSKTKASNDIIIRMLLFAGFDMNAKNKLQNKSGGSAQILRTIICAARSFAENGH